VHYDKILDLSGAWLSKPSSEHIVQFYPAKSHLLEPLSEYVSSGLTAGDVCVVIAAPVNRAGLSQRLSEKGIDLDVVRNDGLFLELDARETLGKFMVNGLPDKGLYMEVVGGLMDKLAQKRRHIRAYGEMVALLWESGNREGVVRLETLWNELAQLQKFSLYCAYPELHFILDEDAKEEFTACHQASFDTILSH